MNKAIKKIPTMCYNTETYMHGRQHKTDFNFLLPSLNSTEKHFQQSEKRKVFVVF